MKDKVEVIQVEEAPAEETSVIDTDKFRAKLYKEMNTGKLWRSVASLAKDFHVDPQKLEDYFSKCPDFISRPGKADGVVYYCFSDRLIREYKGEQADGKGASKSLITEEQRYALAQLHMVFGNLHKTLKTYALEISKKDPEAFNYFTTALDKLESGLCLFSAKTKADISKLPKF